MSDYTYSNRGDTYPSDQGHGHHYSEIVDNPKFWNVEIYTMAEINYTMQPVDCRGRTLETTNAAAVTIMINPTLFAVGDSGEIRQIGAGKVTVIAIGGGTLQSLGGLIASAGQYAVIGWTIRPGNIVFLTGNLA